MVKFGLMVGSADIIGISPTGKFLAVEIKTSKGLATKEQLRFIEAVNNAGGIAGIARSVSDALELIRG
jgi:RecB family endonuclease NucS